MSLGEVASINGALRAAAWTGGAADLVPLWDAFTRHLFEELASRGRCALLAKRAGSGAQLHVEGADGRGHGAFRDPLGIAAGMARAGFDRLEIGPGCTASALEDAIRAIVAGPYVEVPGTDLHELDGRFVEEVTDAGLPLHPGLAYVAAGADPQAAAVPAPDDFEDRLRGLGSAAAVLRLLRERVIPFGQGPELDPYLRAVMARARRFNEDADDVASAVALWSEVARLSGPGEGGEKVVAIMMHVARKRADADLPRERRDAAGAVAIYRAVHGLGLSPEQDRRVILTMMDVANRLTDLAGPWEAVDAASAVRLWTAVHGLDADTEGRARVVRSMMQVANKLTDLRGGAARLHVTEAIAIWRAVAALDLPEDGGLRVRLTMMAVANGLADRADLERLDAAAAVELWKAVYDLTPGVQEDQRLRVLKTMMAAANGLTDLARPAAELRVEAAVAIWHGVVEVAEDEEDRQRAVLTMMALAGQAVGRLAAAEAAEPALRLWDGAHRCQAADRLRVVKTALDVAAAHAGFARQATLALGGPLGEALDPTFRRRVLAGLRYYGADFDGVVELADSPGPADPTLQALKADALRKLGRFDQAIELARRLIRKPEEGSSQDEADARLSALCCRGYCRLEQGREGAATLPLAVEDLEAAVALAERCGLPVPPRAFTGLGYVYQLGDRLDDAEAAFVRARDLDERNRKALEALARLP